MKYTRKKMINVFPVIDKKPVRIKSGGSSKEEMIAMEVFWVGQYLYESAEKDQ